MTPEQREQQNAPEFYRLLDGWTWEDVAAQRAKWEMPERQFPVASVMGTVAWGVPLKKDADAVADWTRIETSVA